MKKYLHSSTFLYIICNIYICNIIVFGKNTVHISDFVLQENVFQCR